MKKKPAKVKKKSVSSKKKERSSSKPPEKEGNKWQEFLRRHSKAQEKKQ